MEFNSKRLIFKEFTSEDFDLFYSVFSDELVMKYALMDKVSCREDLMPFFTNVLENNETVVKRKAYQFAVYLSSNNDFIGFADFEITNFNEYGGCGEIGYFLLQPYWGKGFATEIANTLIEVCFKNIKLHRVCASCNPNNLKSENIMKKVGMIKEGEFRKVRFKNGTWYNELWYSILIDEWMEREIK